MRRVIREIRDFKIRERGRLEVREAWLENTAFVAGKLSTVKVRCERCEEFFEFTDMASFGDKTCLGTFGIHMQQIYR